jgi:hypothetical protein
VSDPAAADSSGLTWAWLRLGDGLGFDADRAEQGAEGGAGADGLLVDGVPVEVDEQLPVGVVLGEAVGGVHGEGGLAGAAGPGDDVDLGAVLVVAAGVAQQLPQGLLASGEIGDIARQVIARDDLVGLDRALLRPGREIDLRRIDSVHGHIVDSTARIPKDALVQFHDGGAGVDAQFLGQICAGVLERGQGGGALPAAVQGRDEQVLEALAQRVLAQQRGQPGDDLGVPVQGEGALGPAGDGRPPLLDERLADGVPELVGPGAGERLAAPAREGALPQQHPLGRLGGGLGAGDEFAEPVEVDALGGYVGEVAPGRGLDDVGERAPQVGDLHLDDRPRRARRIVVPEVVDQPIDRDLLAQVHEERAEDTPLPRTADGDGFAVHPGCNRT